MNTIDILMFAINAILPIILIMVIGYWLRKTNFISREFLKNANKMVFHICLPLYLFRNIAELESIASLNLTTALYTVCIVAVLFVVGMWATKLIPDIKQKGVVQQCIFRSNFSLIGIPLAELMAGNEGVKEAAILSAFTIPLFNVMAVIALTIYVEGDKKFPVKKIMTGIIKNPLIIGVVSGCVVLVVKSYIPECFQRMTFVPNIIKYLSQLSSPLALLALGGQFDFQKIQGYRKQVVLGCMGRGVLAPLLGVGTAVVLHLNKVVYFSPAVFAALISLFTTPVAVSSAIMAEEMKNDGQLAGQLVVWTSLFSVASIFVTIICVRGLGLL